MVRVFARSGPSCAGLCSMWLRPSHPFRICCRGIAGRSERLADHTAPDGHSLERALVVYVGAQKCYVTLHHDIARLGHLASPILAYIAPHVSCVLIMLPGHLATRIMLAGARSPCSPADCARVLLLQILAQGRRGRVVVGDNVQIQAMGDHAAYKVTHVDSRRNLLQRSDAAGHGKPLAANLDQLVICSSFSNPAFSSLVLDRVIVAAGAARIPAIIALNKTDLADPSLLALVTRTYQEAGFTVCHTAASPREGPARGIDRLRETLAGKTSALYGLSGAGKSSLLNSLDARLEIATQAVSGPLGGGKHTTSASRLYVLDPHSTGGAERALPEDNRKKAQEKSGTRAVRTPTVVIDTPGVRSFRPFVRASDVIQGFPEMLSLEHSCAHAPRCRHLYEAVEECAILSAVAAGGCGMCTVGNAHGCVSCVYVHTCMSWMNVLCVRAYMHACMHVCARGHL